MTNIDNARAEAVEAIKAHLTDRYVDHDAEEIAWNVLNTIIDMWDEQEAAGRAETTTEDVWDLGYRAGLRDASRGTPGESPNPYRAGTTTATIEDIADALEHWDRGIDWRLAEQENLTRAAYLRGAEQLMSLLATARTETTTEEWPRCKASRDGGCDRCHDEHGRHIPCRAETTTGAIARGEALAAGDPDWMNVTRWPRTEAEATTTILRLIAENRNLRTTVDADLEYQRRLEARLAAVEALAKGWADMAAQAMDADTREWLAAASRNVFAVLSAAPTDTSKEN